MRDFTALQMCRSEGDVERTQDEFRHGPEMESEQQAVPGLRASKAQP